MSGFSADWLTLREPADAAARSRALVSYVSRSGRFLDLGGGTGANVRYLTPLLPSPQQWTLVDNDPQLLARVAPNVDTRCLDLTAVVHDDGVFDGRALVTASALLDLVSETWLAALVLRCRAAHASVLFALSYDGRIECSPAEPEDEEVRRLVNAHQTTDKGFGPALGPDASTRAVARLSAAGYDVKQERSDWVLEPGSQALQRELIRGWAEASGPSVTAWRDRRLAHVAAGRSRIVVGHVDVAGVASRA